MKYSVLERRRFGEWIQYLTVALSFLMILIPTNGIAIYLLIQLLQSFVWGLVIAVLTGILMAIATDLVALQILIILYPRS